jgi:hypothetical protein
MHNTCNYVSKYMLYLQYSFALFECILFINQQITFIMYTRNFIFSSLGGSLIYFLLGYLFYGILFTNIYPASDSQNMLFVYLGCLTFCVLLSYVFLQWAHISDYTTGAKAGGIIGLLYGTGMNLFMYSSQPANYQNMATDIVINGIMGAIAGAVIAFIISKLK